MTGPLSAPIAEGLLSRFTVHRLGDRPDRDAYLREIGEGVRGVATSGGHGPLDAALLDRLPNLEVVANFGVGYDSVDVAEAARRGVVVTNTPDVLTDEVADLAVGLLIATVRRLPQADRFLREGRWIQGSFPLTGTLRGKRVGILGLGRIGRAIARRLEAFGLEIAYHGRSEQPGVAYAYHPSPETLAGAVDILVVVAPGGAETRRMIDAAVLRALGPDGILVNVARGSVVDEPALIEALRDGVIAAAGLDVFEDEPRVPAELTAMENVVLLPHVGSASVETRDAMGRLVVENLVSWFSGKGPLTPVAETPWSG